jgi:hypothetical protein
MGVSEKSAVRNPGWIGLSSLQLYGNILGINIQLLDKPGNHIVGYICHSNPMSSYGVIINMLTPKPSQTTINDYKQLESTTI